MPDIHPHFAFHPVESDDELARMTAVREAFSAARAALVANSEPSRAQSLALTELETAGMWAIKAVKLGAASNLRG